MSFFGVSMSMSSLSAAQLACLTNAVDTALPADKLVPALGAVAAGRRLLDLSFPVSVTNVGADAALAAQTQAVLASPFLLGAAAASVGVPASAVSATPATVAVTLTITVQSASDSTAIAAALSPSALATQLASAGVTTTGVTFSAGAVTPAPPPVAAAPAAAAAGYGVVDTTNKRDMLAILVLRAIPVGLIGYAGGKYVEKKRQAQVAQAKALAGDVVAEAA